MFNNSLGFPEDHSHYVHGNIMKKNNKFSNKNSTLSLKSVLIFTKSKEKLGVFYKAGVAYIQASRGFHGPLANHFSKR